MADLVERLRAANCAGSVYPMMCEAADEIERLREVAKAAKLAVTEGAYMDYDHSNACMNWSLLEHSQIECGLCQLRDALAKLKEDK